MKFRKPSPGVLVGTLALIVAMSGSAVGASLITSRQIKDGTIQVKDLSKKARAQLKGRAGPAGPAGTRGLAGPAGPAGAPGSQGPPGPVDLKYVAGAVVNHANGTQEVAVALCPGTHPSVVGGGVAATGVIGEQQQVNSSLPIDGPDADTIQDDGWGAVVDNDPGADMIPPGIATDQIQAYAICTTATSVSRVGARALKSVR